MKKCHQFLFHQLKTLVIPEAVMCNLESLGTLLLSAESQYIHFKHIVINFLHLIKWYYYQLIFKILISRTKRHYFVMIEALKLDWNNFWTNGFLHDFCADFLPKLYIECAVNLYVLMFICLAILFIELSFRRCCLLYFFLSLFFSYKVPKPLSILNLDVRISAGFELTA